MSGPPPNAPSGPPPAPAHEVHRRARSALRLLFGRQVLVQVLGLAGGIVVARILGPGPLGVYGIALFVVTLAGYVADLGTRTALIQQRDAVGEDQLATCFTLQQAAALLLAALLFAAAPGIASLYDRAPPELAWMIRVLALDLYLRSWRAMSEIRLERELRYRALALSDIAGSAGYHLVAVGLVVGGWGAQALAWATLAGSAIRIALLVRAAPWRVRFALDLHGARALLRRSLPLQAGLLVRRSPAWITPTLVAGLIGPEAVGLLMWASSLGRKPLELLENAVRVSLPHFARLQDDILEVERVLVRYTVASLLACGLWLAVIATAGHELVAAIYTEPWLPGLSALVLYAGSGMLASVRNLAATALVGIGRIGFTARVSAVASLAAIVSSVPLVLAIGHLGVPLGQLAGILIATPWLLHGLHPGANRRLLRASLVCLLPLALGIAAGALFLLLPTPAPARGLLTAAVICAAYAAATWHTGPAWLRVVAREELALPGLRLRRSDAP